MVVQVLLRRANIVVDWYVSNSDHLQRLRRDIASGELGPAEIVTGRSTTSVPMPRPVGRPRKPRCKCGHTFAFHSTRGCERCGYKYHPCPGYIEEERAA